MDTSSLKTFVLVAELQNFTLVADRRNTVQSAISAQIRRLEDEVGRRLISRGRGQATTLTAEGRAFLIYARRMLSMTEQAVETARTSNARDIIRLGTTVTLAMSVVADVLSQFAALRPKIQIQIQCDRSDRLLTMAEAGDIDVAFMMDQGRHPARAFVHSHPLVWTSSDGFRMSPDDVVPLAFLTDGRDLRHYAFAALDEAGRTGNVSHLSPHPVGVRSFVQAGLALTVMPEAAVVPPLCIASADLGLPDLAPIALSGYRITSRTAPEIDTLLSLLKSAVA